MSRSRRPQRAVDILSAAIAVIAKQRKDEGRYAEFMQVAYETGTQDGVRLGLEHFECRGQGMDGSPEIERELDVPAGWYADPEEDGFYRWWSGVQWTGGPVSGEHINEDLVMGY